MIRYETFARLVTECCRVKSAAGMRPTQGVHTQFQKLNCTTISAFNVDTVKDDPFKHIRLTYILLFFPIDA